MRNRMALLGIAFVILLSSGCAEKYVQDEWEAQKVWLDEWDDEAFAFHAAMKGLINDAQIRLCALEGGTVGDPECPGDPDLVGPPTQPVWP